MILVKFKNFSPDIDTARHLNRPSSHTRNNLSEATIKSNDEINTTIRVSSKDIKYGCRPAGNKLKKQNFKPKIQPYSLSSTKFESVAINESVTDGNFTTNLSNSFKNECKVISEEIKTPSESKSSNIEPVEVPKDAFSHYLLKFFETLPKPMDCLKISEETNLNTIYSHYSRILQIPEYFKNIVNDLTEDNKIIYEDLENYKLAMAYMVRKHRY